MNFNRRMLILLILLVLIICAVACQPPAPFVPSTTPAQTEGTVHLEGNSIMWNTYYDQGQSLDYTTSSNFVPGSTIDLNWGGVENATVNRLPHQIQNGEVDTIVWDLGLNEVHLEGWSVHYQLLTYDMLFQQIPESTCIVLVQQWVTPEGLRGSQIPEIEKMRAWNDQMAVEHPNVVKVDWRPILEAHPEFSKNDGVHLDAGTGAAEARDAMYREGVAQCA